MASAVATTLILAQLGLLTPQSDWNVVKRLGAAAALASAAVARSTEGQ
jgi:hypothetical protein